MRMFVQWMTSISKGFWTASLIMACKKGKAMQAPSHEINEEWYTVQNLNIGDLLKAYSKKVP